MSNIRIRPVDTPTAKADDLIRDLADLLRAHGWVVWTGPRLGAWWDSTPTNPTPVPDVYALKKSYANHQATAYELKVSRGDFLRDVNNGKYQRYLPHCTRLLFAVPAGLVKKDEVPAECGLIVRGPKGWAVQKTAPARQWKPDVTVLLSLIFRGYEMEKEGRDLRDRERWQRNLTLSQAAAEFGINLARRIAGAEALVEQAAVLTARIGEALGRDFEGDFGRALFAVQSETERRLGRYRLAPEALRVLQVCRQMLDGQAPDRWMAETLEECAKSLRKGREVG